MKFSKLSLFSRRSAVKRARGVNVRVRPVFNPGSCFFAVDRQNLIFIETKFTGTETSLWGCVCLKLNDIGRVAFRLFDADGATIGTIVDLGGYAGLVTAINANAVVSSYIDALIIGSIANTVTFSSSLSDVTFFSGGQG